MFSFRVLLGQSRSCKERKYGNAVQWPSLYFLSSSSPIPAAIVLNRIKESTTLNLTKLLVSRKGALVIK